MLSQHCAGYVMVAACVDIPKHLLRIRRHENGKTMPHRCVHLIADCLVETDNNEDETVNRLTRVQGKAILLSWRARSAYDV